MEKLTMKQKQDIIRRKAIDLLNQEGKLNEALLVGANEYAVAIDGSAIGLENQDCWVTIKLTVKNFVDTDTKEAYNGYDEADVYKNEVEEKMRIAAEKKAEKDKKAAAAKARREAKAKKDEAEEA